MPVDFYEVDGSLTGITEFPFDEIDRRLGGESEINVNCVPREAQALVTMARWIQQDGMKNPEGMMIRSAIFCWNVIPEYREMSLTQLAVGYGKKKQSFGRWVDQWKEKFPLARTPHMR